MLPKGDGPSNVKRLKLPEQTDILSMADGPDQWTQEYTDSTLETTFTGESVVYDSYGSSADTAYSSHGSSLQLDSFSDLAAASSDVLTQAPQPLEGYSISSSGVEQDEDFNSVLFQFDTFFRRKYDSELAAFQDNLHSLLTEQLSHVRKIINTASPQNTLVVDEADTIDESVVPNSGFATDERDEEAAYVDNSTRCSCEDSKTENVMMIDMLSLSCQLTELLNQKKFKS